MEPLTTGRGALSNSLPPGAVPSSLVIQPAEVKAWRVEVQDDDGRVLAAALLMPSHDPREPFARMEPLPGSGRREIDKLLAHVWGAVIDKMVAFTADNSNLDTRLKIELPAPHHQ